MNTNTRFNTSQLVILGLMTAVLLLMAYTPLGYLNIGPLAITFNMIPVAVAAITLGPVGGAIVRPASSDGIAARIHLPLCTQKDGRSGCMPDHRLLLRIFKYCAFHERACPAVRKLRIPAGTDGRTECSRIYLHLRRCQCGLRNGRGYDYYGRRRYGSAQSALYPRAAARPHCVTMKTAFRFKLAGFSGGKI